MQLRYHLVNVFTHGGLRLSGNPLCVFEDGAALSSEQMQALARQFNLSETTFILPSQRATAAVRIFTPDFEMPFAGHPTLGTAHIVRQLRAATAPQDALTLEMQAGVIAVSAERNVWTLSANAPSHREVPWPAERLATALGLGAADIRSERNGARPLWVNTGSDQLIVPLHSAEAVRRTRPRPELLAELRSAQGRQLALVFAENGAGAVLARFLFEAGGAFREDPATGSACANLGGWYIACGAALPLHRRVSQGEQIHRPSTLLLDVDAAAKIQVGGEVIYLGGGELQL